MRNIADWGILEYGSVLIVILYVIKGMVQGKNRSMAAFIMFPLSVFAFFFVPLYCGNHYLVPEHFMGLIKLVFLSFIFVLFLKWFLLFFVGIFLKRKTQGEPFVSRLQGGVICAGEALMLLLCCLWGLDYLDVLFEKKWDKFYRELYQNPVYQKTSSFNFIYDIPGAKSFKIFLSALSVPQSVDKLIERPVFDKWLANPVIKKIQMDRDFQALLERNKLSALWKHPLAREFLCNREIYSILTGDEFISECRDVLPPAILKMIEERGGFFSGLNWKSAAAAKKKQPLL